MKRIGFVLAILLAISGATWGIFIRGKPSLSPEAKISPVNPTLVEANTRFGFKLYRELQKQDPEKNVFISPASVHLILAMTLNGARGKTKQALSEALQIRNMNSMQFNDANKALLSNLQRSGPPVEIGIANSIWAREGISLQPKFRNDCEKYFQSELESWGNDADGLKAINSWVTEKTHGKIDRILDRIESDDLVVLVNTVYFKGLWPQGSEFDESKTKEDDFTLLDGSKKRVPMMSRHDDLNYVKGQGFQAVSLPYSGRDFCLVVLLPDRSSNLRNLITKLDVENWNRWISEMNETPVNIKLPRFKIDCRAEDQMKTALTKMGMGIAFYGGCDLGGMLQDGSDVFISRVIHKTTLEVNEKGSEAAAACAENMKQIGVSLQKPVNFIVDRPFFVVIRDNVNEEILFMGSVVDPQ